MIHNTNIHCFFPGYRAHCSCGWKSDVYHATKAGAEYDAEGHKQTILDGTRRLVEHKDESHIPPKVAALQRLRYQQIIDREA